MTTAYTAPAPATAADLTPAIFAAFAAFINQRPGLEPRNYYDPADFTSGRRQTYYGGRRAYDAEARSIQKQGTRARKALKDAQSYSFDPGALLEAFGAFSGRLQPVLRNQCKCKKETCPVPPSIALDYTTGQYWPTEYRLAAAVVLERYCELVRPKRTPQPSDRFDTIADLEAANHAAGGHWFSRDNKRFFRSRILPGIYKGAGRLIWFVSSEKRGFDDERRSFTVRVFDTADASVDSPGGGFGEFKTPGPAQARARSLAQRDAAGEHVKVADPVQCEFCGHYGYYCTGTVPGHVLTVHPEVPSATCNCGAWHYTGELARIREDVEAEFARHISAVRTVAPQSTPEVA